MKFTIAGHAAMLVEANGTRVMVDPWIVGSCYFRSWWNYPKPPPWVTRLEALDYVYLTHMHWDHFHGPSLRKLPRSATVLIPEAHFERMKRDIDTFDFADVIEMPHGRTFTLANGLEATSYQYGLAMDSTLVLSDGEHTLLNMNDCKLNGACLEQVTKRHPNPTFLFRSHSSASAYPYCMTADEPEALQYRDNEDYMSEFVETARLVNAQHAIPFASNHCFLHRETRQFNEYGVSPVEVQEYFQKHGPADSRCTVMLPGDSWSAETGFELSTEDWFSDRKSHIEAYAREVEPRLEASYELEARAVCSFPLFERYFRRIVNATPRATKLVFRPRVVFTLSDRDPVYWVVDFGKRDVYEAEALPDDTALHVKVPASVLKDCLRRRLFATWSASKRLSVHISRGHLRDYFLFFGLLDMYECEYLPLRRMLRPRFVRVWLRRWREIGTYVSLAKNVILPGGKKDPMHAFVPKVDAGS